MERALQGPVLRRIMNCPIFFDSHPVGSPEMAGVIIGHGHPRQKSRDGARRAQEGVMPPPVVNAQLCYFRCAPSPFKTLAVLFFGRAVLRRGSYAIPLEGVACWN